MENLIFGGLLALVLPTGSFAQGFIGVSVAAIRSKVRPDTVQLAEMGKYGVGYFVESPDENHHSVYYVTSFEKTGLCTSYEYVAPLAEKATLVGWLDRFYLRESGNTWRSHNGIVLTLTVEEDKIRLSEEKPVVKK